MTAPPDRLARVRTVADTVLYEGYLLYPYRASSDKNRARWQFGVVGPPGALDRGLGEADSMTLQTVLARVTDTAGILVHLRFLQLQHRQVLDAAGRPCEQLSVPGTDGDRTEVTWDEAVEQELTVRFSLDGPSLDPADLTVPGGEEREPLVDVQGAHVGSVVRGRRDLAARITATLEPHGSLTRLTLLVQNAHPDRPATREDATSTSLLGAHLLVEADGAAFVSLVDPPEGAAELAAQCRQDRCWPFLAGDDGDDDLLLGSPIILYDYPQVAPESLGALFDATEIDEILTLRVMTMTDEEKREARATDPRAAAIIDRCDTMTPGELQQLHGIFRDPRGSSLPDLGAEGATAGASPWWDPAADASVDPETDTVLIDGVPVGKDSLVRVRPRRRADAQDIFFADQLARVTAVLHDVDDETHVAVVLVDDPAADLHDWYGRYFYFAPDEIEPVNQREESRP